MDEHSKHGRFLCEFSKSQTRLYSFILMTVHNDADADEIFQETSSLLWEQFDKFEEGTNFGAWAVAVAKIKVLEYIRQNKKNRNLFQSEMYQDLSTLAETQSANVNHRLNALQSCFYRLERSARSLLTLRYQKNMPVQKIAKQKGMPVGAMYRKLSKVFNVLRRCIEGITV